MLSAFARCLMLSFLLFVTSGGAQAATSSEDVQISWRLLDYVSVDYREAVRDGRIINQLEYDEMVEFSSNVSAKFASLPQRPAKAGLMNEARALESAIAAKVDPSVISQRAKALATDLLAAYPVPLAPARAPDLRRGSALYAANCASCHGSNGEGPSAAFKKLDPAPIAFADRARARDRSLFGLYQVITQGLEGTGMQSYAALPEGDRWALAFYAGTLAYGDTASGGRLWRQDDTVRALVPDLAALVRITPAELEVRLGPDKAAALAAYLRANPGIVVGDGNGNGSLQLARDRLRESLEAFASGDRVGANRLALSAYLDGFEPLEAVLQTRNGGLMLRVEQAMADFRQAVLRGESETQLRARLTKTEALLKDAESALAPEAENPIATFLGAFAILLREGLEALLVVIAMIAFLRKAKRTEAMPYVHGGWVTALVAGLATWFAATYAISISGHGRELAEGVGGIVAAVVLLWVGVWMHGKAQADEWRRYIADKMQGALSRRSAWFLFGLAFLVVYREAFETILFYAALWTGGNGGTILAGALTAVAALAVISWVMLRLSKTLPIGQFFRYSALLIAFLAIILIGKGVGALQEAGSLGITPLLGFPRISAIGLFPTVQSIGAQLAMAAALIVGFRATARPRPHLLPSG